MIYFARCIKKALMPDFSKHSIINNVCCTQISQQRLMLKLFFLGNIAHTLLAARWHYFTLQPAVVDPQHRFNSPIKEVLVCFGRHSPQHSALLTGLSAHPLFPCLLLLHLLCLPPSTERRPAFILSPLCPITFTLAHFTPPPLAATPSFYKCLTPCFRCVHMVAHLIHQNEDFLLLSLNKKASIKSWFPSA